MMELKVYYYSFFGIDVEVLFVFIIINNKMGSKIILIIYIYKIINYKLLIILYLLF